MSVPLIGAPLRARTQAVRLTAPLQRYLQGSASVAWLRHGQGYVGFGEVARFETDPLDAADIWWSEFAATLEDESEFPGQSGRGPIAFGSFAFDPDRGRRRSVLVVPEVLLARQGDQTWMTQIGQPRQLDKPPEVQPVTTEPVGLRLSGGSLDDDAWRAAVAEAVRRIGAGEFAKVVIARDAVVTAEAPIDLGWVVSRLSERAPRSWSYLVDGLVGASPEMLIRRSDGMAVSRVLAGTRARGDDDNATAHAAVSLVTSSKDLREHEFAVASVVDALRPYTTGMHVPEEPYVLVLRTLLHLASDVVSVPEEGVTSLGLAARLHPSAAVCGTPTHVAMDVIAELEHMDRSRYAGPVGWIDAQGDGEWAIALRCGEADPTDPSRLRLFAGCGIVADSDPDEELAEAAAKFGPMLQALGLGQ